VPAVVIPGRKTYRINSTISVPFGMVIQGIGGINGQGTAGGPCFVWGGTAGGTMFECTATAANNPSTIFDNIQIAGRSDGTALPATIIKFSTGAFLNAIDTGTILRNVWLGDCSGNALSIEGGATNFLIENGRFQNWGRGSTGTLKPGYAIYVTGPSGVAKSANITIDGNCTMTNPYACNGGIFLDGEDDTTNALKTVVKFHGLHPEFGSLSLNETYAGGTNPFDKRGWFRIGVNAAVTDVQHHIYMDGLQFDGPFSVSSSSFFQITATSTADSNLDNTRMVNLTVTTGKGLARGLTDGDASDALRLVGGRIHADHRPPLDMGNVGVYHLGIGKNQNFGGVNSYIDSLNYRLRLPVLDPMTVAKLETAWPKQGMVGHVTDSTLAYTSANIGSTVTGGGANFVPVRYNGSAWIIG
jgi:hypothetical protein